VFDPEIPVNIYELGLIYKIDVMPDVEEGKVDVYVEMTLTSPACPVAQEMPAWVQGAIFPLEGVCACRCRHRVGPVVGPVQDGRDR
jgi:metal-sulfur cluster biosynthetic enzyme